MREIWLHNEGMMLLRTKLNFYTVIAEGKNCLYEIGHTGNWEVEFYPKHWRRIGFNEYIKLL